MVSSLVKFFLLVLYIYIHVFHVDVDVLGCMLVFYVSLNPGCVGRVGWPLKIFNPPPQFSRLGIQCPAPSVCMLYVLCVLFGLLG